MRLELIPGEYPRIVLEPWNTSIETAQEVYGGSEPSVVRIWGRRRLKVLSRLLSFAESAELHVLGTGMPAFVVLKAGPVTFTLATTGFSSANWAQGLAFDLLLPRDLEASPLLDKVARHLDKAHAATLDDLASKLKADKAELTAALQSGCQQGVLMYDLSHFRLRPLLDEPLPAESLRFRSRRERLGHDLLAQKGCVSIESENHIHSVGVELVGKIKLRAEKREYRPLLRLNGEGRVLKAECTCPHYRKHALKEGPCEHLIALRLHYGQLELDRKRNPDRTNVTLETRTYTQRKGKRETVYQLTLDHARLIKRWGESGAKPRVQTLIFNSVDDSRLAFFEQVDSLTSRGFIDTRA